MIVIQSDVHSLTLTSENGNLKFFIKYFVKPLDDSIWISLLHYELKCFQSDINFLTLTSRKLYLKLFIISWVEELPFWFLLLYFISERYHLNFSNTLWIKESQIWYKFHYLNFSTALSEFLYHILSWRSSNLILIPLSQFLENSIWISLNYILS